MKLLLKFFLCFVVVTVTSALAASLIAGYTASMSFLISMVHYESESDKILSLITRDKFLFLQVILLLAGCIIIFFLIKINKVWDAILRYVHILKMSFADVFGNAPRSEAWLIFALPVISYIFFAFYLPVAYDEASTYVNFTSRSPLVSILYYPAPNNHILHSVITNFTSYIPFLEPLQAMRISSIAASLITCLLLYSLVRKYYSVNSAIIVTGISSVLFTYVYYSFASRGYALVNLFFVLSLYCVYKIIFENTQARHWIYFSVFSALGFYVMPTFIYLFATLNLALLLNNFKGILRQFLFGFLTAMMVALLYMPVIAVNGLDVFLSNNPEHSVSRMETLNSFAVFSLNTIAEVTGIYLWIIAFATLAALLIMIIRKQKFAINLMAAFIIAPFLLILAHPVIPFTRTFSYYCMVLPVLCIIPANTFLEKFSRKYVVLTVVFIQLIFLYNFFIKMELYKREDMRYAQINKSIAGNHSYYLNCKWYDAVLSFELKTRNFNNAKVKYNNPVVKVNADTIHNYDYIIIDKIYDETKTLTPLYSDKITNVYKR